MAHISRDVKLKGERKLVENFNAERKHFEESQRLRFSSSVSGYPLSLTKWGTFMQLWCNRALPVAAWQRILEAVEAVVPEIEEMLDDGVKGEA